MTQRAPEHTPVPPGEEMMPHIFDANMRVIMAEQNLEDAKSEIGRGISVGTLTMADYETVDALEGQREYEQRKARRELRRAERVDMVLGWLNRFGPIW